MPGSASTPEMWRQSSDTSMSPKLSVERAFQLHSGWIEPGDELGPAEPGEPQFGPYWPMHSRVPEAGSSPPAPGTPGGRMEPGTIASNSDRFVQLPWKLRLSLA